MRIANGEEAATFSAIAKTQIKVQRIARLSERRKLRSTFAATTSCGFAVRDRSENFSRGRRLTAYRETGMAPPAPTSVRAEAAAEPAARMQAGRR
jgi:hypothetical protein